MCDAYLRFVHRTNPTLDFTQSDAAADAVLVVEGKKLHVSRGLLAAHSPYFKSLFFSDFKKVNQEVFIAQNLSRLFRNSRSKRCAATTLSVSSTSSTTVDRTSTVRRF